MGEMKAFGKSPRPISDQNVRKFKVLKLIGG